MASKRRLRRKQCAGKNRHATSDDAWMEIRIILRRYGHQGCIRPYPCKFCGWFHVGHTPGKNGIGSGWR